MLLRLRERKLRRDLQGVTDLARATELQAHLAKVRQALTGLEPRSLTEDQLVRAAARAATGLGGS